MNPILMHTLATMKAKTVSGYAASPLKNVGAVARPIGVQPKEEPTRGVRSIGRNLE